MPGGNTQDYCKVCLEHGGLKERMRNLENDVSDNRKNIEKIKGQGQATLLFVIATLVAVVVDLLHKIWAKGILP